MYLLLHFLVSTLDSLLTKQVNCDFYAVFSDLVAVCKLYTQHSGQFATTVMFSCLYSLQGVFFFIFHVLRSDKVNLYVLNHAHFGFKHLSQYSLHQHTVHSGMEELPSKVSSQQSQLHFSVNHAKLFIWFNHEEANYSIYNVNGKVFTISVVLHLLLFYLPVQCILILQSMKPEETKVVPTAFHSAEGMLSLVSMPSSAPYLSIRT